MLLPFKPVVAYSEEEAACTYGLNAHCFQNVYQQLLFFSLPTVNVSGRVAYCLHPVSRRRTTTLAYCSVEAMFLKLDAHQCV